MTGQMGDMHQGTGGRQMAAAFDPRQTAQAGAEVKGSGVVLVAMIQGEAGDRGGRLEAVEGGAEIAEAAQHLHVFHQHETRSFRMWLQIDSDLAEEVDAIVLGASACGGAGQGQD